MPNASIRMYGHVIDDHTISSRGKQSPSWKWDTSNGVGETRTAFTGLNHDIVSRNKNYILNSGAAHLKSSAFDMWLIYSRLIYVIAVAALKLRSASILTVGQHPLASVYLHTGVV